MSTTPANAGPTGAAPPSGEGGLVPGKKKPKTPAEVVLCALIIVACIVQDYNGGTMARMWEVCRVLRDGWKVPLPELMHWAVPLRRVRINTIHTLHLDMYEDGVELDAVMEQTHLDHMMRACTHLRKIFLEFTRCNLHFLRCTHITNIQLNNIENVAISTESFPIQVKYLWLEHCNRVEGEFTRFKHLEKLAMIFCECTRMGKGLPASLKRLDTTGTEFMWEDCVEDLKHNLITLRDDCVNAHSFRSLASLPRLEKVVFFGDIGIGCLRCLLEGPVRNPRLHVYLGFDVPTQRVEINRYHTIAPIMDQVSREQCIDFFPWVIAGPSWD